jgi:type IV secretory pathway VirB4 component
MRSGVAAHRLTSAHLQAAYPFVAEGGLGAPGTYIGRDLFGGAFVYDAFELYSAGVLTSPNMLVAGQIGRGKSALIKTYIWRQRAFGRRAVIMDPKGEYGALADACGVTPIRLEPGGALRLNPLDRRVTRDAQLRLLHAISSAALERALSPTEKTALQLALDTTAAITTETTLPAVVDALLHPERSVGDAVGASHASVVDWGREVGFELRRLVAGDLAGMFDQETSASIDLDAPLVVLDLSPVYDSDALGILMTCAAAWLQGLLAQHSSTKTIFVLDEAWAILANLGIAKWLQSSFKLSRAYGLQNIAVLHRFSDLAATGAAGSQTERVARGLLSDAETRVVLGQSAGEVAATKDLLGLTDTEAELLPSLDRGVALWKVAQRSFLVEHRIGRAEATLVDTDSRMAGSLA